MIIFMAVTATIKSARAQALIMWMAAMESMNYSLQVQLLIGLPIVYPMGACSWTPKTNQTL